MLWGGWLVARVWVVGRGGGRMGVVVEDGGVVRSVRGGEDVEGMGRVYGVDKYGVEEVLKVVDMWERWEGEVKS